MISAQVKRRQLIRKWPEKLNDVNSTFLPQAATIVQGAAKRNINNVTGLLGESIKTEVGKDRATIGTNVYYAPYVEYGTYRSKAYPFLRPALLDNKTKIMRLWRSIFRSIYGR